MIPEIKRGRKPTYPFANMAIGEFIVVPDSKAIIAVQTAYQHGRKHNKTFCLRTHEGKKKIYRDIDPIKSED